MELVIIAAVAENRVIGNEGGIPWHYPEDWTHFKQTTMGFPVIMGRVTYEGIVDSLGEPLPGRMNIVLSREEMDVPEDVVNVHSIDEAVEASDKTGEEKTFIGGGASVYEQFMERDLVDSMILTEIPESPEGDTYFPAWNEDSWTEVGREERGNFDIVTYKTV